MSDTGDEMQMRRNVRAAEVKGDHSCKPSVVFDPAVDVEDIYISVPEAQEEEPQWGERRKAFVQSARDDKGGMREWTHAVQISNDVPRRFRVSMVHDHPSKHPPQHYTLEYTDYGQFKQNDPELALKLPGEVYQSMLGMSVALREVKLLTLSALQKGEFDKLPEYPVKYDWQAAPAIYAVTIAQNGVIESQWEMGLTASEQKPPQFRSFARNVETGEEFGLFAYGRNNFETTHPALSRLLPEEVYSGMVGLAVGAQMAREMTVEMNRKGELPFDPTETNKNRGFGSRIQRQRMEQSQPLHGNSPL